jgi:hypothetical protein
MKDERLERLKELLGEGNYEERTVNVLLPKVYWRFIDGVKDIGFSSEMVVTVLMTAQFMSFIEGHKNDFEEEFTTLMKTFGVTPQKVN